MCFVAFLLKCPSSSYLFSLFLSSYNIFWGDNAYLRGIRFALFPKSMTMHVLFWCSMQPENDLSSISSHKLLTKALSRLY